MAEKEKVAKKAKEEKKVIAPASIHDYSVIKTPVITEKSMNLLQNKNKVTVKVNKSANKTEIKDSFQRLYQVEVENVSIINQGSKEKSRGGRYKGYVSGYKKAIITLKDGNAIDLFKE